MAHATVCNVVLILRSELHNLTSSVGDASAVFCHTFFSPLERAFHLPLGSAPTAISLPLPPHGRVRGMTGEVGCPDRGLIRPRYPVFVFCPGIFSRRSVWPCSN